MRRPMRANSHAMGRTKISWRHSEMTSDSMPLRRAWKTPCPATLTPAKTKLSEMIRMALTHNCSVSPDKPNT